MAFEDWKKEKKEKAPGMREILELGGVAILGIAHAVADFEQQKEGIKEEFRGSFQQALRNPDLADRIAINLGGDLLNRYKESQQGRVEERTAIHRKTVETMSRFRTQQTAYQAATQQEQEAAQRSHEASHDIDESFSSGIRELTDRLNKWSGRKPKK